MSSSRRLSTIAGWIVFAVASIVYFFSVERTGSLWDCGEFILGAYKLQVVHPPGASLFLLVGRLFTYVADLVSGDPSDIAFSVNLMSGILTAFAATFIAWSTSMLGKLALVGRETEPASGQSIAIAGAGLVAGLATAFTTSVWFSAVEGEVYAMSTFFTTLTLWAMLKWYSLPDEPQHDRWILFSIYAAGLSIGVHLLSILTFPALALFYYFKKYKAHTFRGMVIAAGIGVALIVAIQSMIIVGIPNLWATFELLMVNDLGLPFHTGLIPTVLLVGSMLIVSLLYVHGKLTSPLPLYVLGGVVLLLTIYSLGLPEGHVLKRLIWAALLFGAGYFIDRLMARRQEVQLLLVGAALVITSFSTIGVVVIRANASPPINMNDPSDAMSLIPYLNREQYGERALLRGPHFAASPVDIETVDRYGKVGDHYEIVDQKISYVFDNNDKMLFPRMGDYTQNRESVYKRWMGLDPDKPLPAGRPNQLDNIKFLFQYQLGWMYWRYFFWNFAGRQNGEQGYYSWDKSAGHWLSGIPFLDSWRLYNQSELPETLKEDQARNKYYLLPFLFGLAGLFFHFTRRSNDAVALLAFFVITGIGIIIYSNQPPNEPRERDYVLAGSFFTYCIWIGLGVLALFDFLHRRLKLSMPVAAIAGFLVVLAAPLLMGFENFDDHSRRHHTGARDYANNFLESCAPNAIVFTYGDNDTYPLWYAQEVEGIRKDVRVVNLSLIAVDWYIDLLRRKVNDSAPLKMTIPSEAYRGKLRNQILYYNPGGQDQEMSLQSFVRFIGEDHPVPLRGGGQTESYMPTRQVFLPVDSNAVMASKVVGPPDADKIVSRIPIDLSNKDRLIKDEMAILDIIASNLWERPIYFAVTTRQDKMFGLQDYMQLEGLALRIVPLKSQSNPIYGVVGNGRVDAEAVYDNVMNKFKWGNFDQYDLFVDNSYAPSIQSIQLVIRRAAFEFIQRGEVRKATDLIDQYFEAFPHMNFPYDYMSFYMIQGYLQADTYEKAKPHLEILARETADQLEFFQSLDEEVIRSSFQNDYGLFYRTMEDVLNAVEDAGDLEFYNELKTLFAPYQFQGVE